MDFLHHVMSTPAPPKVCTQILGGGLLRVHRSLKLSNRPSSLDFKTAYSTVYLLCASALAYSESALLNLKRSKLISAFSFPLLLPFARRLHAEAELRRLKIFMTNEFYRIKQCGTLALTTDSLLFAFRQTNQRLYFYQSPSRR
jgi:hypothetical protein